MAKLTETQRAVLAAAAKRGDGAALPLPETLTIKGGAVNAVLRSLLNRGLLREVRPASGGRAARRADKGTPAKPVITDAGRAAIGALLETERPRHRADAKTPPGPRIRITRRPVRASSPPRMSKLVVLVNLLKQPGGASLDEIAEATGWQHHSVRGAISGAVKKRLGLNVISEPVAGRGRVYRIERTPTQTND